MDVHYCYLLLDHFQFTLIHGPYISGSYAILFFTALDFISITSHIHNQVLFLLWLCLFMVSGVISPVAYWAPTDLGSSFQYPIILPFHTVHGVLKASILMRLSGMRSQVGLRMYHHEQS